MTNYFDRNGFKNHFPLDDSSLPSSPLGAPLFGPEISAPLEFESRLVMKTIPIKVSEYRVVNPLKEMRVLETISLSPEGLLFLFPKELKKDTLLRVYVEIPDYWEKKSKHVAYQYTESPRFFQILAKVEVSHQESLLFRTLCSMAYIDPIDVKVLTDYL